YHVAHADSFPSFQHVNNITNFPKPLGYASGHAWNTLTFGESGRAPREMFAANSEPGQRRPTRCIVPAFGHGDQAFALGLFPGGLARTFGRLPPSRGFLRSDGFSYALRRLISRKMPSRCSFFLRTLSA